MNIVHSNFTGSVPEYYESGLVPVIFEDYAKDLTRRIARCKPNSVLELAAGTGVVTRMLRDSLPRNCDLLASDLNEPMLEVAREKFKTGENVTFKMIDAMGIPLEDASVDVVACQFGVMFFPDKVQAYREAWRVLKPGGHFIFNAWDSHEYNPFAGIAQRLVESEYPDDPPGFYKVPFHYNDARLIKREVAEGGFSSVKVKRKRLSKKIRSVEAFAMGLVHGNPLSEEVRARGGNPDELVETLVKAFQSEFGLRKSTMPLSAYVVTGTK